MFQQLRNPCDITVANPSLITIKSLPVYTSNLQTSTISAIKIASSRCGQITRVNGPLNELTNGIPSYGIQSSPAVLKEKFRRERKSLATQ